MESINHFYVINLDKSTERWNTFKRQSQYLTPPRQFTRISGIDGQSLSPTQLKNLNVSHLCRHFCTPEMIGCFLSHQKVWETMLRNNDQHCVVMEDDCEINSTFERDLALIMTELLEWDKDYDILYLGCFGGCDANNDYSLFATIQTLGSPKITRQHSLTQLKRNKYIYIPESPVGLHCYVLSRQGAQKLLYFLNTMHYHVDVQILWENQHFNIWASKKKIGIQRATNKNSILSSSKFPVLLNNVLNTYKDKEGLSISYYFGSPIGCIGNFHVNLYTLIFIAMVAIYHPFFYLFLLYFMIEIFVTGTEYLVLILELICLLWFVKYIS